MKKFPLRVINYTIIAIILLNLAGCTNHFGSRNTSIKSTNIIGFSVINLGNEFTLNLKNSIEEKLMNKGIRLETVSCDGVISRQLDQIENLITMGAQTIIIFPVEKNALDSVLKKAKNKNIKVIILGDPPADKEAYDIALNVNQYELGKTTAQIAANWIDNVFPNDEENSIEVAIIENNSSFEARSQGLEEVGKYTSKAKVVIVYNFGDFDNLSYKIEEYTDVIFSKNPNVKVILCAVESQAIGANEAVMRKESVNKEKFAVFTSDWTMQLASKIVDSKENNSVIRGIAKFGTDLSESVIKAVFGELEVNDCKIYYEPITSVNEENIEVYK